MFMTNIVSARFYYISAGVFETDFQVFIFPFVRSYATVLDKILISCFPQPIHPRLLTPTLHPTGFLKNPSLVLNSPPSLNTNPNLLKTVATINTNSISATFLPTQARGPYEKGMKACFWRSVREAGSQRSGLKVWASGPQMEGRWWMV
jgi:hypothetical protein